ncbi:hypothetical protein, partial [Actinomycetospora chlora]
IFMSIVIVVLLLMIFFGEKSFLKHTKYTIATITSDFHYRQTTKGAGTDFIFFLNNKKIKSGSSTGTFIKGDNYLIAFDSLHPNNNSIFQVNVTDSIYVYPKNGWKLKEIPFKVDTTALKRQLKKW